MDARGALLIAWIVACGTIEPVTDDGGTRDATMTSDGFSFVDSGLPDVAPDVPPPRGPCPQTPPPLNGSCANVGVGLECEYGSSWYLGCNILFTCTDQGWSAAPTTCPKDAGACPVDPDAAPSCSPIVGPCDYADRHCDCEVSCGGPPDPTVYWRCFVPSKQGCPYPRPDVGTACSSEGQVCDYGSCCSGVYLECRGGLWRAGTCVPPP